MYDEQAQKYFKKKLETQEKAMKDIKDLASLAGAETKKNGRKFNHYQSVEVFKPKNLKRENPKSSMEFTSYQKTRMDSRKYTLVHEALLATKSDETVSTK